jgi:hypothetical protein
MTRNQEKSLGYALILIVIAIVLMTLSSCGVNHHLRKSKKHLERAIAKGAKIRPDTTWKTIPVITPEIKFETTLKPVNVKDTLIARDKESGAVTKVFIHKTDTLIRSVFIETTCGQDTVFVKVPVAVNNEIKTPRGFWYYTKWIGAALIVGFILGCLFWASLRVWLKSFL